MPSNLPPPRKVTGKSELDLLLYALSHPLRRRILRALVARDGSAKGLAETIGVEPPSVSYHLNTVLARDCDVVRLVDAVQRRGGVEKVYAIREKRLWAPAMWAGLPPRVGDGLRQFSLREFLSQALAAIDQGNASVLDWQAIAVDPLGWQEITAAAERFRRTIDQAVSRTRDQATASRTAPTVNVVTGIAAFQSASAEAIQGWATTLDEDC